VGEGAAEAGMTRAVGSEDVTCREEVGRWVFGVLAFARIASAADLGPCIGVSVTEAVRHDSDNVAVDGMELGNGECGRSSETVNRVGYVRCCPEFGSRVVFQGVKIDVVEPHCNEITSCLWFQCKTSVEVD